jgi:hypothetical protein
VINAGTNAASSRFYTELYVDGTLRTTWSTDPPLAVLGFASREDYSIGTLSPGTHTLMIKVDSTSSILETDEGDNQFTKTISVSSSQNLPSTGLTVTGRVLSRTTGLPLSGAAISLAGLNTVTTANGSFSLANVNLAVSPTLTASLANYLPQTQAVTATANERSVNIADISLNTASTNSPVVEWVRADVDGIYLMGFGVMPPLRARVNWNGNSAGSVRFSANGNLIASRSGDGPEYLVLMNIDDLFSPSLQIGRNVISVTATGQGGETSDVFVKEIPVIPFPSGLSSFLQSPLLQSFGPDQVGFDFEFQPIEQTVTVPVIGKFGFKFGANASFDYTLRDGSWELAAGIGAEGKQGKRGRRPNFPGLTRSPEMKLYFGNKEIGATFGAISHGTATRGSGIILNDWGGNLAISGRFEIGRFGLDRIIDPTGLILTSIPRIKDALKVQQVILFAKPEIEGSVVMNINPVRFREATATGRIGVEAAYEPPLGPIQFEVFAGGRVTTEFVYPAPVFRSVKIQMYAGVKAVLWSLGTTAEAPWDLYTYPPIASARLNQVNLAVISDTESRWHAIDRPWRNLGAESIVGANQSSTITNDNITGLALQAFGQMGTKASPGAIYTSNTKGAKVIASDSGIPAQATLPLLQNVFPYSEPSLAGRGNELMLVYTGDSGAAS